VIGKGGWGKDLLIPDCIRALLTGEKLHIRNPSAIRPWQHVLEPLTGYLMLAERLHLDGSAFAEAWNFGPPDEDARPVRWIVDRLAITIPCFTWECDNSFQPHEANFIKLDSSKVRLSLEWRPQWQLEKPLVKVIEWPKARQRGKDMREVTLSQISDYMKQLEAVELLH
jgi:CDP-glucose 4,6-dehydratase